MADYTLNKRLELPKSNEKYDVGVANKNNMVIDSELHKLDIKNQSQDELLATKAELNDEILRATNVENELIFKLNQEIERLKTSDNEINTELNEKVEQLTYLILNNKTELFTLVDSLPTSNISPSKIYLLPNNSESENNKYIEYIYVNGEYVDDQYTNGQWENIGLFDINLDNYIKSDQLNTILQNYIKKDEYETENIVFSEILS